MNTQRPLTDDEKTELAALTEAVTTALKTRRDWLDAKMRETPTLQVGDDIYDVNSGARLGKVTELYRYWSDRNDLLDTSVHCDYTYETSPRGFDNTSRQIGRSFGTREDAASSAETLVAWLRGSFGVSL